MLPPAWEDATDGMTTALHITVMPVEVAMSDSQRQARERGREAQRSRYDELRPLHSEGNEMEGRREGGCISWVTAISRNMPLASLSTFGIRREEGKRGNGKTAREIS